MFGRKKKKKASRIGRTVEIPRESQEPVKVSFPGMEAEFKFGNAQHIGTRKQQEDSFGFSDLSDAELLSRRGICAVLQSFVNKSLIYTEKTGEPGREQHWWPFSYTGTVFTGVQQETAACICSGEDVCIR